MFFLPVFSQQPGLGGAFASHFVSRYDAFFRTLRSVFFGVFFLGGGPCSGADGVLWHTGSPHSRADLAKSSQWCALFFLVKALI